MSFCSNCGKELSGDARFCGGCGNAVAAQSAGNAVDTFEVISDRNPLDVMVFETKDKPLGLTVSEREEMFGKLSDRWAWALVGVLASYFVAIGIIGEERSAIIGVAVFILNTVFWLLDKRELEAKEYASGWLWLGILVPIYLFIRAAVTKKYACAVVYVVLFVVGCLFLGFSVFAVQNGSYYEPNYAAQIPITGTGNTYKTVTTGVTLAKFNALWVGMTPEDAYNTLGGKWEIMSESGEGEFHGVSYSIMGDGQLGANIILMFVGRPLRLFSKAQFGLE
jgi:hypothetical protein